MKMFLAVVSIALVGLSPAQAAPADPVKEYAELLHHGAFMCKVQQDTYDVAKRYQSATQNQDRDKVMSCYQEYSTQAKTGLPAALKAAKNDAVRTALKNLYTDWAAYFGEFDRLSESRYEHSESALETELLIDN
ncbi:hypothetical protein AB4P95_05630 [Pseudomonas sp. A1437]|uniref:hypothetical protein n=1 Tax=unclassified Pseudomonas TaxID=196821 RepID=UPI003785224B